MMIPGAVIYVLAGTIGIWLGIGSLRARRWAWTLTVLFSWMWLIMGVCAMAFLAFFMPQMMRTIAQQAKMPPDAARVMVIVMVATLGCIYILLPALFLLFYQRASVWATCQRRDPTVPWTDRCPMPVLALALMHAFTAVFMPLTGILYCGVPLFGVILSRTAGMAVSLLVAVILAWLAWGVYRLKMAAWWGTLLFIMLGCVSGAVTFSRMNLMILYEKMQMPEAQLKLMRESGIVEKMSGHLPSLMVVAGLVWLGYLLFVRRYFVRRV
jgi:hypothetical protein